MTFEPKLDKVIVKPEAEDTKTESGIILTGTSMHTTSKGTVIAVGEGTDDEPMELQAGDKILFSKNSGTPWEHDGEMYIFMKQSDVLSVMYN